MPATNDLGRPPGFRLIPVDIENHMVVVGHHRVGADVHGEDVGQCFHLVLNPLSSMFEALAGVVVFAAQEGAADAAGNAVVVGGGFERDESLPWLGHDIGP